MTREELVALATQFRDAMAADLSTAETSEDLHRATLQGHARLNELERKLFTDYRVHVDCKAGCGTCCHLGKIDARAQEVFALADWMQKNFTPEELNGVRERAEKRAAAVAGLTLEQQLGTVRPCPVLVDQKCSAHPARPGICRIGHSTDVRICERAYLNPTDLKAKSGYHAETKLALTVAADGSTFAFIEMGLDKTTYDLSTALAEALASEEPLERWLRGEPAFSAAAKAKQEA